MVNCCFGAIAPSSLSLSLSLSNIIVASAPFAISIGLSLSFSPLLCPSLALGLSLSSNMVNCCFYDGVVFSLCLHPRARSLLPLSLYLVYCSSLSHSGNDDSMRPRCFDGLRGEGEVVLYRHLEHYRRIYHRRNP